MIGHEEDRGAGWAEGHLAALVQAGADGDRALDATVAAMADAVVIYDATGRKLRANAAARTLFGVDAAPEHDTRPIAERSAQLDVRDAAGQPLPADQLPVLRAARGEVLSGSTAVDLRFTALDGRRIEANVTGAPIRDAAGRIAGAVVVYRDVTARRQLERQVRASEERLRAVITHAPIVLFAVDRDGVFTLSQGLGLAALGIRPDEHVGQSYFVLYGHLPDSVSALRRALAGEEATTINRFRGLVFETRWMPTRAADGAVTGAIGVSADVTARIHAEEERARLARRTRAALGALLAMAQAVVHAPDDGAGDDTSVARRLGTLIRDILDCRSVGLIGVRPPAELRPLACVGLPAGHEEAWRQRIAAWPRDTALFASLATRLQAGEIVRIETTQPGYQALANPFGIERYLLAPMRVGAALVGVLAVDDGTAQAPTPDNLALVEAIAQLAGLVLERDRLLREREEARGTALALREANRRMDEFLGIAGHEMRTPLTTIIGNLQLVGRRLDRLRDRDDLGPAVARELGEAQHLLERSDAALRRLRLLVDDLLDVSRIQAGRLQVRPQPCDLVAVVCGIVEEQRALAPSRTIRLDLPADAAVTVQADAERIGQVVTNYLSNALKYSAEDRPVTVGLEAKGPVARVWVRDEGPGVASEERERIWERFSQAARVEHRHGSSVGLGLGLYISRTIVAQHRGQVGVESASGTGSTFWFTLPLGERAEGGGAPETRVRQRQGEAAAGSRHPSS